MGKPQISIQGNGAKKRELSISPSNSKIMRDNKNNKIPTEMIRFSYNKGNSNNIYNALALDENNINRDNEDYMSATEISSDEDEKSENNKSQLEKTNEKMNKNNSKINKVKNNTIDNKIMSYQTSDKGPFIIIMEKEGISDIQTGKRLNELNFQNILNIKKTARNKLKVQTLDGKTANRIMKNQDLINVDKIKSYLPNSIITTVGVVKNIDLSMSTEEILQNCSCDCKILNIERMTRWDTEKSESVPSNNIKITFRSNKIPDLFKIYFVSRKIEYYIPKPILCKKCLCYGHTTKQCKKEDAILCKICSEVIHPDENQCKNKCKFCKVEEHKTGAAKCPEEIKQKEITKQMTIQKLTYKEAHSQVMNEKNKQFPKLPNTESLTYAKIVSTNNKQIADENTKYNILLNILKEKIKIAIDKKNNPEISLIEIGTLLEKHVRKEKEQTVINQSASTSHNE